MAPRKPIKELDSWSRRAKGTRLTVKLNGTQTADVTDSKHASGPIALQYAPGVVKDAGIVKFRKVQIRAL